MFNQWPHPRVLLYAAAAFGILGVVLLYAGFLKLAPLAILGFVILAIVAMIATTALQVEQAREQLTTSKETVTYDE